MTLPTTAVTRKVEYVLGRIISAVPDDADDLPDAVTVTGEVTISPIIIRPDGTAGRELAFTAERPAVTYSVADAVCAIENGRLVYKGLPYARFLTTDNTAANPINWKYRVTHRNMKHGDIPVVYPDFDFQLPAAGETVLNLTAARPLVISGQTLTVQGPMGQATGRDNQDGTGTLVSGTGGSGGSGAVDTINGKQPDGSGDVALSTDDLPNGVTTKQYTASEKTKLSGIETNANLVTDAEINALADARITASGAIRWQATGQVYEVWFNGVAWPATRPTPPPGFETWVRANSSKYPAWNTAPSWLQEEDMWVTHG